MAFETDQNLLLGESLAQEGEAYDEKIKASSDLMANKIMKMRETNASLSLKAETNKRMSEFMLKAQEAGDNFNWETEITDFKTSLSNEMSGLMNNLSPERKALAETEMEAGFNQLMVKGMGEAEKQEQRRGKGLLGRKMLGLYETYQRGTGEQIASSQEDFNNTAQALLNSGAIDAKTFADLLSKSDKWHNKYVENNFDLTIAQTISSEGEEEALDGVQQLIKSKEFKDLDPKFKLKVYKQEAKLKKQVEALNTGGQGLSGLIKDKKDIYSKSQGDFFKGALTYKETQTANLQYQRAVEAQIQTSKGTAKEKAKQVRENLVVDFFLNEAFMHDPSMFIPKNKHRFLSFAAGKEAYVGGKPGHFVKEGVLTDLGSKLLARRNEIINKNFHGLATIKDANDLLRAYNTAYENGDNDTKSLSSDRLAIQQVEASSKTSDFFMEFDQKKANALRAIFGPQLTQVIAEVSQLEESRFSKRGATTAKHRETLYNVAETFMKSGDIEGLNKYFKFLNSRGINAGEVVLDGSVIRNKGAAEAVGIAADGSYGVTSMYLSQAFNVFNSGKKEALELNNVMSSLRPKVAEWYESNKKDLNALGADDAVISTIVLATAGALASKNQIQSLGLRSKAEVSFKTLMGKAPVVKGIINELSRKSPSFSNKGFIASFAGRTRRASS